MTETIRKHYEKLTYGNIRQLHEYIQAEIQNRRRIESENALEEIRHELYSLDDKALQSLLEKVEADL